MIVMVSTPLGPWPVELEDMPSLVRAVNALTGAPVEVVPWGAGLPVRGTTGTGGSGASSNVAGPPTNAERPE